jgi:hypothetical protein
MRMCVPVSQASVIEEQREQASTYKNIGPVSFCLWPFNNSLEKFALTRQLLLNIIG